VYRQLLRFTIIEGASMEQDIEYIIVGGPQHGLVCHDPSRQARALAIASNDGHLCLAAACRHSRESASRLILLHPQATGEQFLAILAA
jgi:hypothetical protein